MKFYFKYKYLIVIFLISATLAEEVNQTINKDLHFNPQINQEFQLFFTDGQKDITSKLITFTHDGMYTNGKLFMRYDSLETFNNKKCNVENNFLIVPSKFVDIKLYLPKCVAKIQYNGILTFFGSNHIQCKEIIDYVITKMRSSCLMKKNDPQIGLNHALESNPSEGKWSGYAFYAAIPKNGLPRINKAEFFLLDVQESFIKISAQGGDKLIFFKNFNWGCNEDGSCSIDDYIEYLKQSRQSGKVLAINALANQIVSKWYLQDYRHCIIIDELIEHVICPKDIAEEVHLKLALSKRLDAFLINARMEIYLKENQSKNYYRVIHSTSSKEALTDYDINVLPEGVIDVNANNLFLTYSQMKPINNIPCTFEFGTLSLPNQYHEINQLCCARYVTSENNFICMQQQSKCYVPLRRMIVQIREYCIKSQKSIAHSHSHSNATEEDQYSIAVVFFELDNFKYRGTPLFQEGLMTMTKEEIKFNVNSNGNGNGKPVLRFKTLSLNFLCEGELPCSIKEFRMNQDKFLEIGLDKKWQDKTFQAFEAKYSNLNFEQDCMVLISEIASYEISELVVTCAKLSNSGTSMKESVIKFYNKKALTIDDRSYTNHYKIIPLVTVGKAMPCYVTSTMASAGMNSSEPSKTVLKIGYSGVQYKLSGEFLFQFSDLLFLREKGFIPAKSMVLIPKDLQMNKGNININCCLKLKSPTERVYQICITSGRRCIFDKLSLFKYIQEGLDREFSKAKNEMDAKAQLIISQLSDGLPFSFGLQQHYISYKPGFNYGLLYKDTFAYTQAGIWKGWVYEASLTGMNERTKVTPVFMRIENLKIYFTVQAIEKLKPYKKLVLNQYNPLCIGHCSPKEYLSALSRKEIPFDDLLILTKNINLVLAKKHPIMVEKGCLVLGFTSPYHQFGHSHIICAIDKEQGENIRTALDVAYYESLVEMEMDKHVRTPFTDNEKFIARLIIDNKLRDDVNCLYLSGSSLVGIKVKDDGTEMNVGKGKNKEYKFVLKDIAEDNFGMKCAFWYKNMKVREKHPELAKLVHDNNCCFMFFSNGRIKHEICTFLPNNQICVKKARELMKGMKAGCMYTTSKYDPTARDINNEKNQSEVILSNNEFDNNNNNNESWIYQGLMYAGSVLKASQQPLSNPFFVKINREGLAIYISPTDLSAPIMHIEMANVLLKCNNKSLCSPSHFKQYASLDSKFSKNIDEINTVFDLFQDVYSLDGERFEQNCFVLETANDPLVICPYHPEDSQPIKNAILNAYQLFYFDDSNSQSRLPQSLDSQVLGDDKCSQRYPVDLKELRLRYDISPLIHPNQLINESLIRKDYITSLYNDISYSEERVYYRGWFNVYPIELTGVEGKMKRPQYLYGELSFTGFSFYPEISNKNEPVLVIHPETLSMSCGRGKACGPMEFAEKHAQLYSYLKQVIKSGIDTYELSNDAGCTVLENTVNGEYQYYYICPRIRKIVTSEVMRNKSSYVHERTAISAYYGAKIQKIAYDAYLISRKFLTEDKLPTHLPAIQTAWLTAKGQVINLKDITITNEGVLSNSQIILNFETNGNCRVWYNLMYAPSTVALNQKKECCVKMKSKEEEEEIMCNNDINCEYKALAFAKAYKDKCRSLDPLKNEFRLAAKINELEIIRRLISETVHVTELPKMIHSFPHSGKEFLAKHLSIAAKYLLKVREIMLSVEKADILDSAQMENNVAQIKAESREYLILASKGEISSYQSKTNGDLITIINDDVLIKANDFNAIFTNNSKYVILAYMENGLKIFEIGNNILLTDSKRHLQLNNTPLDASLAIAGIVIPE